MNNHIFTNLLEALEDEYGEVTQVALATALGVTQATISNWTKGKNPSKSSLKKIIELYRNHHAKTLIKPLLEFFPIDPVRRNSTWDFSTKESVVSELKDSLDKRVGIYIFYDTSGTALYLGKTERSLYSEAKQRLKALPNRPIYKPAKAHREPMGSMARYLSAYEISIAVAVKNIETFMLRAFPNDLRNVNGGNFNLKLPG